MFRAVANSDPLLAGALIAGLMLGGWSVGWRWGRRNRARGGEEASESRLGDASLAILGLLLAFTFSMALNKYDRRRDALVTDSNAIGDFYTCAGLLPEPNRGKLQAIVRDYTRLRLEIGNAPAPSDAEIRDVLARFDAMQSRMTEMVREALSGGTPIAVPLVQSLNSVQSSQATRLAALRDRLPGETMLLLAVAACLTSALVGREQSAEKRPSFAGTAAFIIIVSLTVCVTVDLNHPTRGVIRTSQEPMERLLGSMGR
ncbi:MAG TPA: hypothetical protein VGO79_01850 [Thermoanaerobaculia bacterium]|jgi:MFS family permease